jgi:2-haloacid dehalogenase
VHPWDIHGAKRAGLRAGWLDRQGGAYPEVFEPPDATARDFPALVRALVG